MRTVAAEAFSLPEIPDGLDKHVFPLAASVEVDLSEWAASILNYAAAMSENHDRIVRRAYMSPDTLLILRILLPKLVFKEFGQYRLWTMDIYLDKKMKDGVVRTTAVDPNGGDVRKSIVHTTSVKHVGWSAFGRPSSNGT